MLKFNVFGFESTYFIDLKLNLFHNNQTNPQISTYQKTSPIFTKSTNPYFIIISNLLLMPFSAKNLDQIESHLATHPYLSEGGLPGADDAQIFFDLGKSPVKASHPNAYFWYQFINSFSNDLMKKWIEKAPKPAQKTAAKNDEDDLFGDDDAAPVAPKPKPQPPVKKEKVKAIAKSIVIFEVKVEDIETDLDALAKKVFERTIEGLVWSKDVKKLDVAYGIQKLQIGCVIEDDKVATDDIFEPIEAWEEVQSVDMVSMQKL